MDRNQLLNDAETAMRLALDGRQSTIWTAMPGIIQSVNMTAMTCEVQPTIQGTVENENGTVESVDLPLLVDVPLVFPGGGGYILTFPLSAGNEVLVVFASRCIDAWWQSGGIQRPMEARMHDLSDGFAIPGPRSQLNVVTGISTDSVQLRSNSGATYLGVTNAGKIEMANATKNLRGILNGMLDLLNTLNTNLTTFATTTATDPIAVVTAGAATALIPTLATLAAQIAAYKTADVGVLIE